MGISSPTAHINKINYFEVSPRIVRAGKTAEITVKTKFISRYPQFVLNGMYHVAIAPVLDFEMDAASITNLHPALVEAKDGVLTFDFYFESEQDYFLKVWQQDPDGDNRYLILQTLLYALDEDLYDLVPLRGNTHLHSCFSDGLEEPLQHLGAALKQGFDYIALTDHNNYEGSVKAKYMLSKLEFTDIVNRLTVLNGEEFSCDYQPMHIISLGATEAVPEEFYIKKDIPTFDNPEDKYDWITEQLKILCDEVHKRDGLVVLCHPYWKPIHDWIRMDAPYRIIKRFLETGLVDGFEVVGGSPKHQNIVSECSHLLALESLSFSKRKYAFLGESDSHVVNDDDESCIFPNKYTIAFCKDNSRESILGAIRNDLTVAVEETDGRCEYFGTLRLVNFCRFLEKYYFPKAKEVSQLYKQVFDMCAVGSFDDGKRLSDALGEVKLFEYGDLKK